MRSMFLVASFCMAATSVLAEGFAPAIQAPTDRVTLTTGCVYARNHLGAKNEWSLIYTEAGTTAYCALKVYGLTETTVHAPAADSVLAANTEVLQQDVTPIVAQATPSVVSPVRRPRLALKPGFLVGVFR